MRLRMNGFDGPIVVEIEYQVTQAKAGEFCDLMQEVQLARQRNGAFGWSIARDLAELERWVERYSYPTWHDFLRQRSRHTQSERALESRVIEDFHIGPAKVKARRMLERLYS